MAEKRMFSGKIVESDAFYSLSFSAQALYMHLNMSADDDGVIACPNRIINGLCHPEDEKIYKKQQRELRNSLQELIEKRFLLSFSNGICIIKHWRMMNNIKRDRYKPSAYQDIICELTVKENQAYTEKSVSKMSPKCLQNVSADGDKMSPECLHRLDKIREDKISIVQDRVEEYRGEGIAAATKDVAEPLPTTACGASSLLGKWQNVSLTKQELAKAKVMYHDYQKRIDALSDYLHFGGRDSGKHYDMLGEFEGL